MEEWNMATVKPEVKKVRKATGKPEAKKQTPVQEKAAMKIAFDKAGNKTRRATGEGAQAFWYLDRSDDLAEVTAEASNAALGIEKIDVFEPTQAQAANGILCKIRLITLCGKDDNISIFASQYTDGDIYMQMGGGRKAEKDGKDVWYRDRKLNNAARAQILSYVHSLLETE